MLRARCTVMVAAIAFVLVAAFSAAGLAPGPHRDLVARQAPPPATGDRPVSVSERPDTALSFTAVELGRAPIIVRSESRQASRSLTIALLAVALLLATMGRRGPRLRQVLEQSIRSRTEWWRPVPGGRAPPRLSTA